MFELEIVAIKQETQECKTFVFHTQEHVEYLPGQFLTFLLYFNGREIRRSYSISSSPALQESLAITIKRTPNGEVSRWWMETAEIGDSLTALQPAGRFTLQHIHSNQNLYFAAAGSGITPIYSIIKSLLFTGTHSQIILIYSNSSQSETIFLEELKILEQRFSSTLKIVWFFSDNPSLLEARLSTHNLQRIIEQTLRTGIEDAIMYTCGPYYYMQVVQITCLTMGFARENISKELFDINAIPASTKKYFDKTDRTIHIVYKGKSVPLLVPHHETILDAALKSGIDIPYSCKAGKCSTCVCKIIEGKVWMHYNEVLTDKEIGDGLVLTCTGHPASENVSLKVS